MAERRRLAQATRDEFIAFLQDSGLRVDSLIEGAIETAEEVHAGVKREDGRSPFLETHTWPVAIEVVRHYRSANRSITGVEVASAILHDVMEDDGRILNLYESKSYGFDAYLAYRFGSRVYKIASELKVKPLDNFVGATEAERQAARFWDYCGLLCSADYDVKAIKLADRLNNMAFIASVPGHDKVRRYMREAEDFYLAYAMLPPKMPEFYSKLRQSYEDLRAQKYAIAA
ncbi:HD domain-containing protein [Nitrososphaera sp.]|uniref:HD domain-containing protein n=1 Tax=Nitrososphaera sp. TaxID=1971748 RepID=UPI00307F9BEB